MSSFNGCRQNTLSKGIILKRDMRGREKLKKFLSRCSLLTKQLMILSAAITTKRNPTLKRIIRAHKILSQTFKPKRCLSLIFQLRNKNSIFRKVSKDLILIHMPWQITGVRYLMYFHSDAVKVHFTKRFLKCH